ncbi:MAG TPA: transcriptional regulator [Elusimicrobia bacterium]|nr:transcriptional regulator [Elusimicrobiota bacterium]
MKSLFKRRVPVNSENFEKKIFEMHAELCKTLSNPKRLEILSILRGGEKQAGEISTYLKISKANLSQHLSILKQKKLILQRRSGVNLFYRVADPRVYKGYDCLRDILLTQLQEHNKFYTNINFKEAQNANI